MSRAVYMGQWRKCRIEDGICPECGGELDLNETGKFHSACPQCRERRAMYSAKWRMKNPSYHTGYWKKNKNKINTKRRNLSTGSMIRCRRKLCTKC